MYIFIIYVMKYAVFMSLRKPKVVPHNEQPEQQMSAVTKHPSGSWVHLRALDCGDDGWTLPCRQT